MLWFDQGMCFCMLRLVHAALFHHAQVGEPLEMAVTREVEEESGEGYLCAVRCDCCVCVCG